jgi:hypothetical protein
MGRVPGRADDSLAEHGGRRSGRRAQLTGHTVCRCARRRPTLEAASATCRARAVPEGNRGKRPHAAATPAKLEQTGAMRVSEWGTGNLRAFRQTDRGRHGTGKRGKLPPGDRWPVPAGRTGPAAAVNPRGAGGSISWAASTAVGRTPSSAADQPVGLFFGEKSEFSPNSPGMALYRRRLPHDYETDQPVFLTGRLHDSLPRHRAFPSARVNFGQAFAAMDRLLEEARSGPFCLWKPFRTTPLASNTTFCTPS